MASNPFLGGFAGDSPFGVPRGSRSQLRAPGVVSPAQPANPALGMGRGVGGLQAGLDAFRNWRSQRPGGPAGVGGGEAAPGGFPPLGGVAQGAAGLGQRFAPGGDMRKPQPAAPAETPRQRAERQAQQKAKR